MKHIVSKRIKVARAEQDLSQADLAEMLHLSPQNIAKWESGEINIGVDSLERIALALEKPIEWFFLPFEKNAVAKQRLRKAA